MREVFVLYNKKNMISLFGKNIITQIQDLFVLYMKNVLFIEYEKNKREKIRKYIHSISDEHSYIILLGNHKELEFEKTESPAWDGDNEIFTDNYWSVNTKDMLIPELSVSRIPIHKNERAKEFLIKLEKILRIKNIKLNEKFGISASIWYKSAERVFDNFKGMGELLKCPKYDYKKKKIHFKKYNYSMYFNVHGSKDLPGWYGQRKNSFEYKEEYPIAAMPEMFSKGIEGSFILSEACYGGYIINKTYKKSIFLQALKSGIGFAIGSTAIAYGSFKPPLSEADLFIKIFINEFQKGKIAGDSFVSAKRKFAIQCIKKNGFLDGDDKKTLLEFTFYGNPFIGVNYE